MINHPGHAPNSLKWLLFAAAAVVVAQVVTSALTLPEVQAQSTAASAAGPPFEAVSIKPNTSGDASRGCCQLQPGGQLTATNVTLRQLIQFAYQRHGFDRREVSGGPAWIDSQRFDVVAKATDGTPRQTQLTVRTLLADRFKLRVHTESQERPIYALLLASSDAKIGPRLHKPDVDCGVISAMFIKGERPAKPTCSSASYPGRLVGSALTMAAFASVLSGSVDRLVTPALEPTPR